MSNGSEWRSELPATLEAIEILCADFKRWRAEACTGVDAFASELLLREALANSARHGCSEAREQRILCILRAKLDRLLILVRDEGAGFDWNAAAGRTAGVSDSSGRGIEILRHYASAVRFNPKGNSVTLVKRF